MSIIDTVLKLFLGDKSAKDIKIAQPLVDKALSYQSKLEALTHDQLRAKTQEFKDRINASVADKEAQISSLETQAEQENSDLDTKESLFNQADQLKKEVYTITEGILHEILPEAFAVVKETARRFVENTTIEVSAQPIDREISARKANVELVGDQAIWHNTWDAAGKPITWDMVHYDVQLIGGIVLHQGKIAEMATGEGKTLVATLPIYLNALTGKGVHVVTVNNYLARRDAAWMAPLFEFHGLRVDCIDNHQPNSPERRAAYLADVTYGTNAEFGFDYLRDNGARESEELVQRPHNYAIVDEVDSVLIDDARTPLIISGPVEGGDRHEFNELKPQIELIVSEQRAHLNKVFVEAKKLIAQGKTDIDEGGLLLLRVHRGLPKSSALIKFLSEEGNKQLLLKTENYYMQDNNRQMPTVDEDLLFTIEEKHNTIQLTDRGIKFLSKSSEDENFFVMPDIGLEVAELDSSELSDIEKEKAKDELYRDFSIKSQRIHTMNQLLKAYTLFEKDVEYVVMDAQIKIVDEQTGRIMEGRRYSDGLHQAIEAKENVKIENATQTYATITLQNYFRMYKKLAGMTGTAITEANEFWEIYKLDVVEIPTNRPISRVDSEDLLYKTKREKYKAVIDEIKRLCEAGRPVLVGTTSVEVSELLSKQLNFLNIKHNVLNAKMHTREAEIIAEAGRSGVVTIATNMAGRGTDIKLAPEVKAAGGLAIIGTERHDSRRVDRQLRGRAGRQGDPGTSQFYISLEDNLMRLFASEKLAKIMDFLGLKEGDVIQDRRITNMVEKAQKRVEENHFGSRKNTLEYDNVMNSQREVIYRRRHHALFGERLSVDIANMIHDTCYVIVETQKAENNYTGLEYQILKTFALQCPIKEENFSSKNVDTLTEELFDFVYKHIQIKMNALCDAIYPFVKSVYETQNNRYRKIGVPFSDGTRAIHVGVDLEKAYNSKARQLVTDFEKDVVLTVTDLAWKQHLRDMDDLRESVRNAVYEQKDPVLIYKLEAFELFQLMIKKVNTDVVSFLYRGEIPQQDPQNVEQVKVRKRVQGSENRGSDAAQGTPNATQEPEKPRTFVRDTPKLGRNDRLKIQNVATGETRELKFKQAEPLLSDGKWIVLEVMQ